MTIKLQRVLDSQGNVLLYCHSPARQEKDRAIDSGLGSGLEAALAKLQASLSKPESKAVKSTDMVTFMQRLGRAKQRFARAAQHDEIPVATDDSGERVSAITWVKRIKPGSAADLWRTDPGVYCLRTDLTGQVNATLWRTYIMLTELESVFRSLKTDLGLRPVLHRIDRRVEGACAQGHTPKAQASNAGHPPQARAQPGSHPSRARLRRLHGPPVQPAVRKDVVPYALRLRAKSLISLGTAEVSDTLGPAPAVGRNGSPAVRRSGACATA